MTNKEVLQKAIEKAVENGFDLYYYGWGAAKSGIDTHMHKEDTLFNQRYVMHYYRQIFSHSFAKAFWGEELHEPDQFEMSGSWECPKCKVDDYKEIPKYCWQRHLQQMVLEEEPLKYLEEFLVDKK